MNYKTRALHNMAIGAWSLEDAQEYIAAHKAIDNTRLLYSAFEEEDLELEKMLTYQALVDPR